MDCRLQTVDYRLAKKHGLRYKMRTYYRLGTEHRLRYEQVHTGCKLLLFPVLCACFNISIFIYLPHYNNYKKMPKKIKCRKRWRGGLKETIELMLIRPPQLQFFEDGIKITATDTI